jgi:hypothetical protein
MAPDAYLSNKMAIPHFKERLRLYLLRANGETAGV